MLIFELMCGVDGTRFAGKSQTRDKIILVVFVMKRRREEKREIMCCHLHEKLRKII